MVTIFHGISKVRKLKNGAKVSALTVTSLKKAPFGPRPFWTSFSHGSRSARGGEPHKEKQIAYNF